ARQTRNAEISAAQMMAIGDALRTDVAGARTLGIDVLMTADGIHGHDLLDERRLVDAAKAAAFFASAPLRPDYVIARLIP
ncbi:MAG: HAD hydrolase-like protein, partial [Beijerinckiaceae bacterium]